MKGVAYTDKRCAHWLEEDGKVVLQTKRDEFRCVVRVMEDCEGQYVTFTSASGKPLYNLQGHTDVFIDLWRRFGTTVFDTGVCIDESFDVTRRVCRASKKQYDTSGTVQQSIVELKRKSKEVLYEHHGTLNAVFWLYDLPESECYYADRRQLMAHYCLGSQGRLMCPETEIIEARWGDVIGTALAKVHKCFAQMVEAGHEGAMVKRFHHDYKVGRSLFWMKLKPSEEIDVSITGYTEGEGKFAGLIGSICGVAEDGTEVSFSGFSDELRAEISANREAFLGRWAEVRFMQRDSKGGLRHPQFYRWHPDK